MTGRAGDHVPPALDQVRRSRGPFKSDDDLLNAVFYGQEILGPLLEARDRPLRVPLFNKPNAIRDLVSTLAARGDLSYVRVRKSPALDLVLGR